MNNGRCFGRVLDHFLVNFKACLDKNIDQRWAWIKEKKVCGNYLIKSHYFRDCRKPKCDINASRRPYQRSLHSFKKKEYQQSGVIQKRV